MPKFKSVEEVQLYFVSKFEDVLFDIFVNDIQPTMLDVIEREIYEKYDIFRDKYYENLNKSPKMLYSRRREHDGLLDPSNIVHAISNSFSSTKRGIIVKNIAQANGKETGNLDDYVINMYVSWTESAMAHMPQQVRDFYKMTEEVMDKQFESLLIDAFRRHGVKVKITPGWNTRKLVNDDEFPF